jgi:hypothetical protein
MPCMEWATREYTGTEDPFVSGERIILHGLPEWTPQDVMPGTVWPLAVHVNGDLAAVLYLRRWKDGSFHWECANAWRAPNGPWAVMSTDASNLDEPPFERRHTRSDDQLLRIYHGAGYSELSNGKRVNVKRTVAGDVSSEVTGVQLKTSKDLVFADTASGLGVFVLVAKEKEERAAELHLLRRERPPVVVPLPPLNW